MNLFRIFEAFRFGIYVDYIITQIRCIPRDDVNGYTPRNIIIVIINATKPIIVWLHTVGGLKSRDSNPVEGSAFFMEGGCWLRCEFLTIVRPLCIAVVSKYTLIALSIISYDKNQPKGVHDTSVLGLMILK